MVDRRIFLEGALAASAGLAPLASASATAAPVVPKTFVLVHGAWHNSHHWQPVARRLSALGHVVVTVDLPAHGLNARFPKSFVASDPAALATEVSPVKDVTLAQAAESVASVLRSLGDAEAILVAHSLGGAVATQAAELAADRIRRLIYLTAFVPVGLPSAAAYGALPEFQTGYGQTLFVGNPADIGAVRINPRGDAAYLHQLREAYYNDVAFDEFLPFATALTPDLPLSYWIGGVSVSRQQWGRIPRTFIRCGLDRALALAIQDKMIADADRFTPNNKFDVVTIASSHSSFASVPEEVTRLLAQSG